MPSVDLPIPKSDAPLLRLEGFYLETAFEAIEARHSAVLQYLADVLDVDEAAHDRLAVLLLEPDRPENDGL